MNYLSSDCSPSPTGKISLSLRAVAEKVVTYFSSMSSTIFDINDVANTLNVPKRRLYDVLNIMSPLGLVERNGRGKYVWTGSMQPICSQPKKGESTEKLHVRDLSARFLGFIKDTDKNTISLSSLCDSVFEEKSGQLRRMYDILAVFEVLNLIRRQPKSGDFLVLPLLRNMFMVKMLPPKKRGLFSIVKCNRIENSPEIKQPGFVSPPLITKISNGQLWLGATVFH